MIWVLSHNGLVGVAPVHRQMTARETAAATGKFKWLLFGSCSSPTLPTMPVLPGNFDCIRRNGSGDLDDLNNFEHVGYGIPQPPIKRQSSKLLTPLIQPILGLSRTWKVKFLVNLQPPPAFVRTLSYQKTEFSGGLPYYELGQILGNLEAVFLWSSHCLKTTKFCPRTLWHIALETRLFRGHIISTKIFHIPKK